VKLAPFRLIMSAIVGPIPPFSNPPIAPQYYQPSQFTISAISLGTTTTVTTTANVNYVIGQLVRLLIPASFGCRQLNQQEGYVLSLPAANQVLLSIDSSQNVDPYVASSATTVAQIVSVGDVNQGYVTTTGRSVPLVSVPGAFINISPL
jgi:hypothetical protein